MSDEAISRSWARLREAERKALIPYVTAGYPTREQSLAALDMVQQSGADLVELGIPFSDPLADGPAIQHSSEVALERGMTVAGAIELAREASLRVPVILFGYLNPVLAYGLSRFLDDAEKARVGGLLLTDLPPGEDPDIEQTIASSSIPLIPLVAPTTRDDRLETGLRRARGFVYLIARLGVTGAPTDVGPEIERMVARVRAATELPVAVGFGIATGEQARQAARVADGVVVGSALVRRLGESLDSARELMEELRAAIDGF
ncbi:MAG: tryptophan synthase subunit alpha [Gemmatimonadales bacterium]